MSFDFTGPVHLHTGLSDQQVAQIVTGLSGVTTALQALFTQGEKMSAQLDTLTRDVAQTKSVIASAVILISGLAKQIRDNATDPAALQALAADLENSTADLAGAVSANTEPAPTPTPAVPGP